VTPGGRRRGPQLYLPGEFGFVPAGPVPDDPRSIIDERGLAELVDSAGAHADTVIVDAPPIGMFSDVLPLAQRVGGVVVAVRLHHTRRAALERLLDRLATASIRPIGIVVLGARQENAGYGHYAGG
jgi:Mrp family chromosome partitioning ATPase